MSWRTLASASPRQSPSSRILAVMFFEATALVGARFADMISRARAWMVKVRVNGTAVGRCLVGQPRGEDKVRPADETGYRTLAANPGAAAIAALRAPRTARAHTSRG